MPEKYNPAQFVKYGKIEEIPIWEDISSALKGEVYVFEKIDGGNCHVQWVRNNETQRDEIIGCNKANYLTGGILHTFPWFEKFNQWLRTNPSLVHLPPSLVPFGEWSGNHTIQYIPENTDQFFLVDVAHLVDINFQFLPYDGAVDRIKCLGIQGVSFVEPLLVGDNIHPEQIKRLIFQKSQYYDGPKEGVVIKNYNTGNPDEPYKFYKVLHPLFSELRKNPDGSRNYITLRRLEKILQQMTEEKGWTPESLIGLAHSLKLDIVSEGGPKHRTEELKLDIADLLKLK